MNTPEDLASPTPLQHGALQRSENRRACAKPRPSPRGPIGLLCLIAVLLGSLILAVAGLTPASAATTPAIHSYDGVTQDLSARVAWGTASSAIMGRHEGSRTAMNGIPGRGLASGFAAEAGATRGAGDAYAGRVLAGGRADGETVFAGHGEYRMGSGTTTVPEGTSVTTYAPHGQGILDSTGGAIETGGGSPFQVFGPGEQIPNYTLRTPDGLTVYSGSTTVESSTFMSDLLKPGMGSCHWAACLYTR